MLIIVSEFNGHFFGAYLTDPLCTTGFKFTGSGECCVFKSIKTLLEEDDEE